MDAVLYNRYLKVPGCYGRKAARGFSDGGYTFLGITVDAFLVLCFVITAKLQLCYRFHSFMLPHLTPVQSTQRR